MKFDVKIFRKSVEKIEVLLRSEKNSGYFTYGLMYLFLYLIRGSESSWKANRIRASQEVYLILWN